MREYPWEFPLNVPGWTGHRQKLINLIVSSKLWDEMPIPLLNRLVEAQKNDTGIAITKHDLDSISDETWTKVLAVIKKTRGF